MNNRRRLIDRLTKTHYRMTPEEIRDCIDMIQKALEEWLNKTIKTLEEAQ
jgi:hypothetical protein